MYMKKYRDFIPHADAELSIYAGTYRQNFRRMAAEAIPYLSDADIEEHEAEVQEMIDAIYDVEKKKADLAAAVARKKELVQAVTTKMRAMAMYAKKGKAGKTGVVTGGGLKCNPVQVDVKSLRPQLHITTNDDYVSVAFRKNYSLPIALYSRKPGDSDWEFISYATTSPYIDRRPASIPGQPESREYKAYYTNFKDCISQASSIIQVVFHPMYVTEKEE